MRQRIGMILTAMLVLFLSVVFAQEKAQNKTETQSAMQMSGMKESGMMGKGMMDKGMMDRKIVSTRDGGVVIWIGNKLFKYDKDLKLVKETELKIDMSEKRQKMMWNKSDVDPHTIDPYHHAPKN
jgi:hypothetical protein